MTSLFYGLQLHDWINYPTYNWLFFRPNLDKDEENLIFGGAILASAALFIMPNSPVLWFAAGMDYGCFHKRFYGTFQPLLEIIFRKATNQRVCNAKFFLLVCAYFAHQNYL
jgi:hypothetical protein